MVTLGSTIYPSSTDTVSRIGLAYKPNVGDDRESPSYILLEKLQAKGVEVAYYDPHVQVIPMTPEHAQWAGTKSITCDKRSLESFDTVVISTSHDVVDYLQLANWCPSIVDTRNAMAGAEIKPGQVIKA
ncbi:MAG: hypothetical protein CMK36_08085 [Porticoccaceae bacterium]|nr:hypothetical protein [Porticoccaceae bacterium]